jgi:hypothetical protein
MSGLGNGASKKKRTALSGEVTILFFSRYLTASFAFGCLAFKVFFLFLHPL